MKIYDKEGHHIYRLLKSIVSSLPAKLPTSPCSKLVILVCRRPLVLWRTHGPVELASELLTVIYVDVVKHILVHHISLWGKLSTFRLVC